MDQTLEWDNLIKQFWNFDSICVDSFRKPVLSNRYLLERFLPNCTKTAYWSTYFPDPKSDMNSVDANRILKNKIK